MRPVPAAASREMRRLRVRSSRHYIVPSWRLSLASLQPLLDFASLVPRVRHELSFNPYAPRGLLVLGRVMAHQSLGLQAPLDLSSVAEELPSYLTFRQALGGREPLDFLRKRLVKPNVEDFFELAFSCHTRIMAYRQAFVNRVLPRWYT